MHKKHVVTVLLLVAGLMLVMPAFAAGRNETTTTTTASTVTAPGTFPIVTQPASLSIVRLDGGPFYDHDTNWFTQFYEEKTGVETNMIMIPGEQFKERVNLMFASRDPIDLIVTANNGATIYTKSEQMQLANQGVIQPLNQLIDNQSLWLKNELIAIDGWRDFITGPDGSIYGFPYINECFHCTWYNKMWLNTTWLENLGLEVPTTTDEFRNALRAFRDQDANLNGDPNDEIPLMSSVGAAFTWLDGYIMSAFIYSDGQDRLFLRDGQVVAAFAQPEYRDGLRYLADLYAEGLIYPESFVQDRGTQNQLLSQKPENIVGATPAPHHGYVGTRPAGELPRWFDYIAIPPITGPAGVGTTRWDYYNKFGLGGGVAGFVPSASQNADLVMRFVDWMYSEEGSMAIANGPEGITWEQPAPGEVGILGQPAIWKTIQMVEGDDYFGNAMWGQNFPAIVDADLRAGQVAPSSWYAVNANNAPLGLEKFLHELTRMNYEPYSERLENIMPPLFFPAEDIEELAQLRANIYPYVNEALARFTIGDLNIETDWNRHLRELENLGLSRFITLMQKAYDMSPFAGN